MKYNSFKGNKTNLPSKPCGFCNREFSWRKKWERCWSEVRFCSDRCRMQAKKKDLPSLNQGAKV